MSAFEALQQLEGAGLPTVTAKAVLADQLREGRICIAAKLAWTSSEASLPDAWKKRSGRSDVVCSAPVPTTAFRKTRRLAKDPERWNWPKGRFYITIEIDPRVRRMIDGVHFRCDEIAALASKTGKGAPATDKVVDEAPPQKVWWDWVHELTVYLHENGWEPGITANGLFEKLDERLSNAGRNRPSRSTVYTLAKHLVERAKSDERLHPDTNRT